jgi:hypothetical protein
MQERIVKDGWYSISIDWQAPTAEDLAYFQRWIDELPEAAQGGMESIAENVPSFRLAGDARDVWAWLDAFNKTLGEHSDLASHVFMTPMVAYLDGWSLGYAAARHELGLESKPIFEPAGCGGSSDPGTEDRRYFDRWMNELPPEAEGFIENILLNLPAFRIAPEPADAWQWLRAVQRAFEENDELGDLVFTNRRWAYSEGRWLAEFLARHDPSEASPPTPAVTSASW